MKTGFSKVLSVVLCLILMAATTSVAFAAAPALPGQGTEASPYQVADADALRELIGNTAAYNGKYIALAGNITLDGDDPLEPIGTADAPFSGFFDGKGYSISNFEIYGEDDNVGLFGYAKNASFANVSIQSSTFYCGDSANVGALVGYAENTVISKVKTNNCTMDAGSNAGGIVGTLVGGSVSDCTNGCSVVLNDGDNAGGIVGKADSAEILRCINSAAVDGQQRKNVGGIVGNLNGTVSHCLNNGVISSSLRNQASGTSSGTAGIAGSAAGEISFCGNAGEVHSDTDCSGIVAVAGQLTVSNCYNADTLTHNSIYDGISYPIAPAAAGNANCVYEGDLTAKDAYAGWDFTSVWFEPADYHGYAYPVLRDCNFHTLTVKETQATCTLPGGRQVTCLCGLDEHQETAAALGHNWVVSNVKEANCTYEGEKTYKCSRCQEEKPEKEILPVEPDKHVDADNDNICDLCEKTIKEEEVKKSFFQRVIDFFKRIFDWIRNLFTRNKDN